MRQRPALAGLALGFLLLAAAAGVTAQEPTSERLLDADLDAGQDRRIEASLEARFGRLEGLEGISAEVDAGVVVLGGTEIGDNTLGLVFILIASGLWATYIVVGAKVAAIGRGVTGLGVGLAIGALATTPIGAPWSGPVWLSPSLLALCLVVGVFSNAIGYGIDQFTLRRIPIRRFSLLLALLPVTASLIGWFWLGQQPTWLDVTGIALVLVGVAVQERDEIERLERVVITDPA
jgi:inner membrane transporter RhtA